MTTLTQEQINNISHIAKLGQIADEIAILAKVTGSTVEEMMPMLKALAEKKFQKIIDKKVAIA